MATRKFPLLSLGLALRMMDGTRLRLKAGPGKPCGRSCPLRASL